MNETAKIAPVRKSIRVKAPVAHAFDVFTNGLSRWWPLDHSIGKPPVQKVLIEPRLGGRWLEISEDGAETAVATIIHWEPPHRLVMLWQINAQWKPDATMKSEVDIRFIPDGPDAARVELVHHKFGTMGAEAGASMRKDVDGGWPGMLERYAALAETDVEKNRARTKRRLQCPISSSIPFPAARSAAPCWPRWRRRARPIAWRRWRRAPSIGGASRAPPLRPRALLEHGDFTLYETQAILRYLDRVLPAPALTPRDPPATARMDQLMNVNDWYLFQGVGAVIGVSARRRPAADGPHAGREQRSRPSFQRRDGCSPNWLGCWETTLFRGRRRLARGPAARAADRVLHIDPGMGRAGATAPQSRGLAGAGWRRDRACSRPAWARLAAMAKAA